MTFRAQVKNEFTKTNAEYFPGTYQVVELYLNR